MKKGFLMLCSVVLLFSCQSTLEERAQEAVKAELYKNLYDFDSYEPLETKVDSAFNISVHNSDFMTLMAHSEVFSERLKALKRIFEAAERDIASWSSLRSYGGTAAYEYNKAKKERAKTFQEIKKLEKEFFQWVIQIKRTLKESDGSSFIGWKVIHKYRVKTRGGIPDLRQEIYIFSKDFKELFLSTSAETYHTNAQIASLILEKYPPEENLQQAIDNWEKFATEDIVIQILEASI